MDEKLICEGYKFAKDKNKQIQILADLNDCSTDEITDILSKNGLIQGTPTVKKVLDVVDWSVYDGKVSELAKEGLKAKEIAERLGIKVQAIYDRKSFLKKQADKLSGITEPKTAKPIKPEAEPTTKQADFSVLSKAVEMLKEAGFNISIANFDLINNSFSIHGTSKKEHEDV